MYVYVPHLQLNEAFSARHVKGALEGSDAISHSRPVPAAQLVALVNLHASGNAI